MNAFCTSYASAPLFRGSRGVAFKGRQTDCCPFEYYSAVTVLLESESGKVASLEVQPRKKASTLNPAVPLMKDPAIRRNPSWAVMMELMSSARSLNVLSVTAI